MLPLESVEMNPETGFSDLEVNIKLIFLGGFSLILVSDV